MNAYRHPAEREERKRSGLAHRLRHALGMAPRLCESRWVGNVLHIELRCPDCGDVVLANTHPICRILPKDIMPKECKANLLPGWLTCMPQRGFSRPVVCVCPGGTGGAK